MPFGLGAWAARRLLRWHSRVRSFFLPLRLAWALQLLAQRSLHSTLVRRIVIWLTMWQRRHCLRLWLLRSCSAPWGMRVRRRFLHSWVWRPMCTMAHWDLCESCLWGSCSTSFSICSNPLCVEWGRRSSRSTLCSQPCSSTSSLTPYSFLDGARCLRWGWWAQRLRP